MVTKNQESLIYPKPPLAPANQAQITTNLAHTIHSPITIGRPPAILFIPHYPRELFLCYNTHHDRADTPRQKARNCASVKEQKNVQEQAQSHKSAKHTCTKHETARAQQHIKCANVNRANAATRKVRKRKPHGRSST